MRDPPGIPSFAFTPPQALAGPFLFNSPHSGRVYDDAFLRQSRLDALSLRRSEDAYVDELFAAAPRQGAALLCAHFPRAFLDVNREPYELDPALFAGRLPAFAKTRSTRIASGLGTIPRLVADGHDIYAVRLPVEEGLQRIEQIYKPYHHALHTTLHQLYQAFGYAVLVDCHSMPSVPRGSAAPTAWDMVLGDRFGTSCAPALMDRVQNAAESLGLRVTRNTPYAGGYITEHYGAPAQGRHALQIEVNRALYLDEASCEKRPDFKAVQDLITGLIGIIVAEAPGLVAPRLMAAE